MRIHVRTAFLFLGSPVLVVIANAQTTAAVSVDSLGVVANGASGSGAFEGTKAAISSDGRLVAFVSSATNLVNGDTNGSPDIFVRDVATGSTERVSVGLSGAPANSWSGLGTGVAISADGRFVVYDSLASNLVSGDTNGVMDVFVYDRSTSTTERVNVNSVGVQSDNFSGYNGLSISADGRFVAYSSPATNLVAGDTNGFNDVFVRDRVLGSTTRVSVATNGAQGMGDSIHPSLSGDGSLIAFRSTSIDLDPAFPPVAGQFANQIYLHDRASGTTSLVSLDPTGTIPQSGNHPSLSTDGRYLAFLSGSSNLVPGDTNSTSDVFVRELATGLTERVNVSTAGAQANQYSSAPVALSTDGRRVAFGSRATNLAPGWTGYTTIFLRDRLARTTEIASASTAGAGANYTCFSPGISGDGRRVVFASQSSNLVAGDTNGVSDVFLRDVGTIAPVATCLGDGGTTACPCGNNGTAGRGCANSVSTAGATITATGSSSLAADTLTLTTSGEPATALSLLFQGGTLGASVPFGDGLRCIGGRLIRIELRAASGGSVTVPQPGSPSISARSAAQGAPIRFGATLHYQVIYRDPAPGFCAGPTGGLANLTNAVSALWTL